MSVIYADRLKFAYQKNKYVLDDISFEIAPKESVGLIGANGAGKSTLLKLLTGLAYGYEGELSVNGISVTKKNFPVLRKSVGYVFQDSENQLFMSTVYNDVAFGPANMGIKGDALKAVTEEALDKVHILDIKDRQSYRISGGQKKLAAIATVLSMKPSLLLFDEPSVALDPRNRRNLIKVINELECTKLIASHDIDFVRNTCGKVILLSEGRLIAFDTASSVLDDERLLYDSGL